MTAAGRYRLRTYDKRVESAMSPSFNEPHFTAQRLPREKVIVANWIKALGRKYLASVAADEAGPPVTRILGRDTMRSLGCERGAFSWAALDEIQA
jgi:hypothetical protein